MRRVRAADDEGRRPLFGDVRDDVRSDPVLDQLLARDLGRDTRSEHGEMRRGLVVEGLPNLLRALVEARDAPRNPDRVHEQETRLREARELYREVEHMDRALRFIERDD